VTTFGAEGGWVQKVDGTNSEALFLFFSSEYQRTFFASGMLAKATRSSSSIAMVHSATVESSSTVTPRLISWKPPELINSRRLAKCMRAWSSEVLPASFGPTIATSFSFKLIFACCANRLKPVTSNQTNFMSVSHSVCNSDVSQVQS
jgi:hypothetical protein